MAWREVGRVAVVIAGTVAATSSCGANAVAPLDASDASGGDVAICPGSRDAGVEPPSCAPGGAGMTNCGACSASCCASIEVTGGTYYRSYANTGSGATGEADPATVSTFRLDEYEVTVGRFRQFVSAWNGGAGYTPPAGAGRHTHLDGGMGLANSGTPGTYEPGWLTSDDSNIAPTDANLVDACTSPVGPDAAAYVTWTPTATGNENLPINCVNWWEAYAFCAWDGGFLPSEAEWEYAAAGGSQQREYPWGEASPGSDDQFAIYDCHHTGSGSGGCTGFTDIAAVGTATQGAGLWGHLDLAGNVQEWTLDGDHGYVNPCADCADLAAAPDGVIRGGDYLSTSSILLSAYRSFNPPANRVTTIGFRCARAP